MGRWSQYRHRGRGDVAAGLSLQLAELELEGDGSTGVLHLTFNRPLQASDGAFGATLQYEGGFGVYIPASDPTWTAGATTVDVDMEQEDNTPVVPEVLQGTDLGTEFISLVGAQPCPDVTDFPCPQSF